MAGYEELISSADVDAVYIPLPTAVRKPWVLRAVEAGKHVLAEKPVGLTAADVAEILAACRRRNVQFMDGVMFMHSRRMDALRQVLDDQHSVGRSPAIATQFCFRGSPEFFAFDIRVHDDLEPLGCLGDLGWYNIRFILWALRGELPTRVAPARWPATPAAAAAARCRWISRPSCFFPPACRPRSTARSSAELQQWAHVGGTAGHVFLPDFVLPYFGSEVAFEVGQPAMTVAGCDFNIEPRARRVTVPEYGNAAAAAQESNMFRTFAAAVLSKIDPTWGDSALKTQQVLDACLQSARQGGQPVELAS